MPGYPVLLHTAIDARDCRGLAEFHRDLLGLHYRPGDEIPATRRCFTTDLRMRENLSMSWPTPPDTPSAFSFSNRDRR